MSVSWTIIFTDEERVKSVGKKFKLETAIMKIDVITSAEVNIDEGVVNIFMETEDSFSMTHHLVKCSIVEILDFP